MPFFFFFQIKAQLEIEKKTMREERNTKTSAEIISRFSLNVVLKCIIPGLPPAISAAQSQLQLPLLPLRSDSNIWLQMFLYCQRYKPRVLIKKRTSSCTIAAVTKWFFPLLPRNYQKASTQIHTYIFYC